MSLKSAIIDILEAEAAIKQLEVEQDNKRNLIQQRRKEISVELSKWELKPGTSYKVKVDDQIVIIGRNGLIEEVDLIIYTE